MFTILEAVAGEGFSRYGLSDRGRQPVRMMMAIRDLVFLVLIQACLEWSIAMCGIIEYLGNGKRRASDILPDGLRRMECRECEIDQPRNLAKSVTVE